MREGEPLSDPVKDDIVAVDGEAPDLASALAEGETTNIVSHQNREPQTSPRSFRTAFASWRSHLRRDRIHRALLGTMTRKEDVEASVADDADSSARLIDQLQGLYKIERERQLETRRRSDQWLTRLIATAPFIIGLFVLASTDAGSVRFFALGLLIPCVIAFILALVAVLNNLGKEVHEEPTWIGDIEKGTDLVPRTNSAIALDTYGALIGNEARNNDAIDRLHTALALFIVAVFLGLIAGALLFFSRVVSDTPEPPATSTVHTCRLASGNVV